jgi:hypothetical protein
MRSCARALGETWNRALMNECSVCMSEQNSHFHLKCLNHNIFHPADICHRGTSSYKADFF